MAGTIPKSFIQDLLARSDIIEIIDSYTKLKKTGKNHTACCPFHNEKTPSFNVSAQKQLFHCFGCGESGDVLTFIMKYEHLEFVDAIDELAKRYGLQTPKTTNNPQQTDQQQTTLDCLEQTCQYYQQQLQKHPQAIKYLKQRNINADSIQKFRLGYAPPGWDNLIRTIKHPPKNLNDAGLTIEKENGGYYDRFRNRIIYPIFDRRGRVIGFGGRTIDEEKPKYINSPETTTFHKSEALYGYYQMQKTPGKLDKIYLVEGYMDVIALHQNDIPTTVATLGTATSTYHIQRMLRTCPHIAYCFDGDNAGRQAAWRALETTLPAIKDGHKIDFIFLPEGEDPDSLIQKHGKKGLEQKTTVLPLTEFIIQKLTKNLDPTNIENKASAIEQAKPIITKLTDSALKDILITTLAEKLQTSTQILTKAINKQTTNYHPPSPPKTHKKMTPIRTAIAVLLQQPTICNENHETDFLRQIKQPGHQLLYKLCEYALHNTNTTTAMLIEQWRNKPEHPHLTELANWQFTIPEEGYQKEFDALLENLRQQQNTQTLENLINQAKTRPLTEEEKKRLHTLLQTKSASQESTAATN